MNLVQLSQDQPRLILGLPVEFAQNRGRLIGFGAIFLHEIGVFLYLQVFGAVRQKPGLRIIHGHGMSQRQVQAVLLQSQLFALVCQDQVLVIDLPEYLIILHVLTEKDYFVPVCHLFLLYAGRWPKRRPSFGTWCPICPTAPARII